MNAPLTHYVVIRRDLTFGEYSAQLAHAGEAYAVRRDLEQHPAIFFDTPQVPHKMALNETIAVVKGARNEGKLLKLEAALAAAKVPHVAIREERGPGGGRLAGQLTCISLMPTEREKVEQLLRDFHNIQGLDGPKAS